MSSKDTKIRCTWCLSDPLYQTYHDEEWGRPVHDEQKLFELLSLECMQAGLSWLTVLKKRPAFRVAFDDFIPEKIAVYDQEKISLLLNDSGIIRHRGKIEAVISNAQCWLALSKKQSFADFLWQFTQGKTQYNHFKQTSDIPTQTPASQAMSQALKAEGFRFVGPTICYALMQAMGMVNDHIVDCYQYSLLSP